jgi:TrmH family RNA methyltransferase
MKIYKPLTNNLKKIISGLKDKKNREEENLFVVEGEKLCEELLSSSYICELVVLRSTSKEHIFKLADKFEANGIAVYIARSAQFENLCDTKTPQDIIAVVRIQQKELIIDGSYIALDGISDPGNLGTIIRTADWFGFKNIVLGNNSVDRFNPKTVRSTMGSLFRLNILSIDNLADFLRQNNAYTSYGASLKGSIFMDSIKVPEKFGLVFGNEANGLSKEVENEINILYKIKGYGKAESLNVGVSVGISAYYFSKII